MKLKKLEISGFLLVELQWSHTNLKSFDYNPFILREVFQD